MTRSKSFPWVWGLSSETMDLSQACDSYLQEPEHVLFRGVEIDAPAAAVFRWLCQLRVAPHSYDLLDNLGQPSPRQLIPGLENLAKGQRVMTIFELLEFERDCQLTIRIRPNSRAESIFGSVVVSYLIKKRGPKKSALLVKLLVRYPRSVWGRFMRLILPPGDFFMMRKQLLSLKELAEASTGA